ncbi:transposase, IS605 OrfB family protein, partial [Natrialba magadii ATCC 43099]
MSDHLSLPIRLPDEEDNRFGRLATLTRRVANHVLEDHWTPAHLDGIADASHQAWKYFDEHEPFDELGLYLPSRFRRCILQKVGETLRSHADKRDAFQSIQSVLPAHKIRRIHRRRIKEQLWDDGDYLSSGYVDI